jgi:CxxC-x17-CxxC domain-containing protein
MGNYNNDSSFDNWRGGGNSRGGGSNRGSDRGGYGNDRPQMHPATCAKCNTSCEVPFKPNGRKPIYCSDCFVRDDEGGDRDRGRDNDRSRGSDRPRRDDRSRGQRPAPDSGGKEVEKHLKTMVVKMDHMIKLLTELTGAISEVEDELYADDFDEDEIEVEVQKEEVKKLEKAEKKAKKEVKPKKEKKPAVKKPAPKKPAKKKPAKKSVAKKKPAPKKK